MNTNTIRSLSLIGGITLIMLGASIALGIIQPQSMKITYETGQEWDHHFGEASSTTGDILGEWHPPSYAPIEVLGHTLRIKPRPVFPNECNSDPKDYLGPPKADVIAVDYRYDGGEITGTYCAEIYHESPDDPELGKENTEAFKAPFRPLKKNAYFSAEAFSYKSNRGNQIFKVLYAFSQKDPQDTDPYVDDLEFTSIYYDKPNNEINFQVNYKSNIPEDQLRLKAYLDGTQEISNIGNIKNKLYNIPTEPSGSRQVTVEIQGTSNYNWKKFAEQTTTVYTGQPPEPEPEPAPDGEVNIIKTTYDDKNEELYTEIELSKIQEEPKLTYYINTEKTKETKIYTSGTEKTTLKVGKNQGDVKLEVKLQANGNTLSSSSKTFSTESLTCPEPWQIVEEDKCVAKQCSNGTILDKETGRCIKKNVTSRDNETAPVPGGCGDGVCAQGETSYSCPSDCGQPQPVEREGAKKPWVLIVGLIASGVVLVMIGVPWIKDRF